MCSQSPLCTPTRTTVAEVEAGAENEETSDEYTISFHVSAALNTISFHVSGTSEFHFPLTARTKRKGFLGVLTTHVKLRFAHRAVGASTRVAFVMMLARATRSTGLRLCPCSCVSECR